MLNIDDLKVSLEEEEKQIIKGLSLSINPGEVHAIMGPNGSGQIHTIKCSGRERWIHC